MKTMKLALLGGAALAVSAIGAQADDLSALKAEIEALNARVQQLEAAPAAPAGYSLLTSSVQQRTVVPGNEDGEVRGISDTAHVIGVLPTADAAPSTTIEWSGYVYAIVAHTDYDIYYNGDSDTNVLGRAHLRVVGKTDTAVGEVGVRVQLRSQWAGVDGDNDFFGHEYWGWWAMTPELTLGGGYSGSLGNIGYGLDGACNCWWTDWFSSEIRGNQFDGAFGGPVTWLNALNPGDTTQVRLSYASGPLSFAIALEDSDIGSAFGDLLAVAGEIKYSGDSFSGEVSAIAYETGINNNNSGWQVGAGVGFGLGDMANVSLAAGVGDSGPSDYWSVSGLINFNLSDAVHAEVAAAYGESEWVFDPSFDHELLTVIAGIYYAPVSQLTIGLEGQWSEADLNGFDWGDFTTFDVVTIYSF